MEPMHDIANWQRRFYAQPKVWLVVDRDGVVDGAYETQEAAQVAVDWARDRGEKLRINSYPICTLDLSLERWKPARLTAPPGEE